MRKCTYVVYPARSLDSNGLALKLRVSHQIQVCIFVIVCLMHSLKWQDFDDNFMMVHFLFAVPTSPAQTSKTKHSLLPDPSKFSVAKRSISGCKKQPVILAVPKNDNDSASFLSTNSTASCNKNLTASYVRWTKSLSCCASIAGCSSTIKEDKQPSFDNGATDGFLVDEFASSPIHGTVLSTFHCVVTLTCL